MTQHPPFPVFFVTLFLTLFVIAVAWNVCFELLVRALAGRHPFTYEHLGRPAGISRMYRRGDRRWNFAQTEALLRTIRFILTSGSDVFGDRSLSQLVGVMRVLFWAYTVGFGGLVVWMAAISAGLSLMR